MNSAPPSSATDHATADGATRSDAPVHFHSNTAPSDPISRLKAPATTATATQRELTRKLSELDQAIAQKEQALADLREKNPTLHYQFDQLKADMLVTARRATELMQQHQQQSQAHLQAQSELQQLKDQLQRQLDNRTQLESQLEALKVELHQHQPTLSQEERQAFEHRLETAEKALMMQRSYVAQLQADVAHGRQLESGATTVAEEVDKIVSLEQRR